MSIATIPASSACKAASADVVWVRASSATRHTITGNTLTKTSSNAWDGNGFSWQSVGNNGYMQTTVQETNHARMIGLSNTDVNSNWTSIQYAFYLTTIGTLEIRENSGGNLMGGLTYATGDVLRIAVENNVVKYYRNGTIVYASLIAPTLPMYVDVSTFSIGATVANVKVVNGTQGDFAATVTNTGTAPTYQWNVNGANVGTNSSAYTNTAVAQDDVISCVVTADVDGCSPGAVYTSNSILITDIDQTQRNEFWITGTAAPSTCMASVADVVWRLSSSTARNAVVGNTLTKVGNSASWNGNGFSWQAVANNGYMQTTVQETNLSRMVGLSATDANADWIAIQYAFYLTSTGALEIRESNSGNLLVPMTYTTGDVLRIAVENNIVKYYRNGAVVYISTAAPTLPLYVDVSTHSVGATVANVKVANSGQGSFTATTSNAGPAPAYQWKVNGVSVGTNSTAYTNTALSMGDLVTCVLTPDLAGCAGSAYVSNPIVVGNIDQTQQKEFRITGTAAASNCIMAVTDVVWRLGASTSYNAVTGNTLTKMGSSGVWNGNGFSWQGVANNGYMQTTVQETNLDRMIGLSATDVNSNWTSIQYAFHLVPSGALNIRESNSGNLLIGMTYATGDVLRIAVENNVVKYYRNGVIVYISTTSPTLPLYVDVSTNSARATVANVKVANGSGGDFTATAINAGTAPTYQWKLNGANVGTSNSAYTNTAMVQGDLLTCTITADVDGCNPSAVYTSNSILITDIDQTQRNEFRIAGTTAASTCNMVVTDVVWRQGASTAYHTVTGNALTKVGSSALWTGNGFSWQSVGNNGYMQTTAQETNRLRMIGLSATDVNSNFTSIQYGFYLTLTGTLEVRENGSGNLAAAGLTYATGDVLRIAVENNIVKYYCNSALVYNSLIVPTLPLYVDVSTNGIGATVANVKVANGGLGSFTASANDVGTTPAYQWKLNGANVGTSNPTYTNTAMTPGDVVTCVIIADVDGCSPGGVYTSNSCLVTVIDQTQQNEFRITGTAASAACQEAVTNVVWRQVASTGYNTVSGNTLTKVGGNSVWNGNGFSWQSVGTNGYMETTVLETNRFRMIGLSATDVNSNWTSIQYGFYLTATGTLEIHESGGVNLVSGLTYASGDVLRIAVENGIVKYYRNGTILCIGSTAPTLPLYVDVSTNGVGATTANVKVANWSAGDLTATANNAGTSPTYQWKLNGANVGTSNSTYTNTGMAQGDVITCVITTDVDACIPSAVYTSNSILITNLIQVPQTETRISSTAAVGACQVAVTDVVWRQGASTSYNTVTGSTLMKLGANAVWNGNGFSWQSVGNNGYMETTAQETNRLRMIGLSAADVNGNWTSIQYGFHLTATGTLEIHESGGVSLMNGVYATGDVLRIAVENNIVKYYRNGTLVFISTIVPTLPLYVDVSTNNVGATVANVKVANGTLGDFTATASNAGTTPTYQWKLNGANVGASSSAYTNAAMAQGDIVSCMITAGVDACIPGAVYTSNAILIGDIDQTQQNEFRITGTAAASACLASVTDVVWRLSSSTLRNTVAGNALTRFAGASQWNGNGFSWQSVGNNGYMETTVQETNLARMIGLSATDANADWVAIQYAFYLTGPGTLEVRENGISSSLMGAMTYATGDVLRIAVENNIVKYYRNGTIVYISLVAPTLPLYVDVSTWAAGATVANVKVANGHLGNFTATASNAGAVPTYQWKLNGANVGTNSAVYTNTSLVAGDTVTCLLTPDLTGCAGRAYVSNRIVIGSIDQTQQNEFRISSVVEPDVCTEAVTNVVWRLASSTARNTVAGNTLTKLTGNGVWNGNGFSWQSVGNNGYVETTVQETNLERMIGLSPSDLNADWTAIRYALYLTAGATIEVRENSGISLIGVTPYTSGDVLRIAVENMVVKYYRNNTLLYTSALAPTLPLFVDVSIKHAGGTVANVRVGNGSAGSFAAVATNAGVAPTYQWKLNGANVGTNASTYSNGSLVNGDVVSCMLTPDLPGCAGTAYTSNISTMVTPAVTTTNWLGASTAWNATTNWSAGVPGKYRSATITAGANNPVISTNAVVNGITIGAGRSLTIAASNTLEVFGNWNNNGTLTANTSTVRFQGCASGNTIQTAAAETFYNAAINNRYNVTVASGTHNVTNAITFQRGIVFNLATILAQSIATATGMSDLSYVDGPFQKAGTLAFTFPVGGAGFYRPIAMAAPTSSSTFSAEYFEINSHPLYSHGSRVPSIDNISDCEYWNLVRTAGTGNAFVTLSWNMTATPGCQVLLPSDLTVAGWTSGTPHWQDRGNASTTGNNSNGTVTSSSQVAAFGPFALASQGGANPLPIELLYFTAAANGQVVDLAWVTASEMNNERFVVERSADAITYAPIAEVDGAGNSVSEQQYATVDEQPLTGLSYYRLKQVDFDGTSVYSDAVPIYWAVSGAVSEVTIYPNPSAGDLNVSVTVASDGNMSIAVFDATGRIVISESPLSTTHHIDAAELPGGEYRVVVLAGERVVGSKAWIKQ